MHRVCSFCRGLGWQLGNALARRVRSSVCLGLPTVDGHHDAVDERCLLRQQERDERRHLVRLTEAPHRVDADELARPLPNASSPASWMREPFTISVMIAPGAMALIDTPCW